MEHYSFLILLFQLFPSFPSWYQYHASYPCLGPWNVAFSIYIFKSPRRLTNVLYLQHNVRIPIFSNNFNPRFICPYLYIHNETLPLSALAANRPKDIISFYPKTLWSSHSIFQSSIKIRPLCRPFDLRGIRWGPRTDPYLPWWPFVVQYWTYITVKISKDEVVHGLIYIF